MNNSGELDMDFSGDFYIAGADDRVSLDVLAKQAVEAFKMLHSGDTVIVALSGGADSVALLYFLLSIKNELNLNIFAAHVNHNLRGKEALEDQLFVEKLCKKYDVRLFLKSADVGTIAKNQKISTELCGRNIRYEFFEELSKKYSAKIATAHTASDNAETVIFNLTRGCGLKGMTGITPVRDYIIRPLIFATRTQVENYCRNNFLSYVTDSSNLTDDYTRNLIRHKIIPILKTINPDFDNTISRTRCLFDDAYNYIEELSAEAVNAAKVPDGYKAEYINNLSPALKSAVIVNICKDVGVNVQQKHIKLICENLSGGAVDLTDNKKVVISQGILRIIQNKNIITDDFTKDFHNDISFEFNSKRYSVEYINTNIKSDLLSSDKSVEKLFFRTRKAGDTITLPYRNVTKTLKKLFIEEKIPAEIRDKLLVLTDGKIIYWVEKIGFSKQGFEKNLQNHKICVEDI